MKYSLIIAGSVLLVVGLLLYISIPLYYPGYGTINDVFKTNRGATSLGPNESEIIKNISAQKGDAILFLVLTGNVNVSLLNSSKMPIINQQRDISVALNQSTYYIQLINTGNTSVNVTYTYGIFNAESISNFYYGLGIFETFLEILILIGGAMILWAVISWILTKRK
ncbi:MAG: hypothetical protein QXY37_01525 [Metallosphaera sp.]